MKRKIAQEGKRYKIVPCDITTIYSKPFVMLMRDNKAVGKPLTKEEAELILSWLNSITLEWIPELSDWDIY